MSCVFQAGGPLPANSRVYVERKADHEALWHLRDMGYLLLIEPRQQGKTSLITKLYALLKQEDYVFVYIDIEDFDYTSAAQWFARFHAEVDRKLGVLPGYQKADFCAHSDRWLTLAQQAQRANKRIVVAIDEIGSLSGVDWAEEFFGSMRSAFQERSFEPSLNYLTFILAGAFNPRDLIRDPNRSPFNVAQRVHLPDLEVKQVRRLVAHLGLPEAQTAVLAERIHDWTGGQPYLTQLLCEYLAQTSLSSPSDSDVHQAVRRLIWEDENHLPPLIDRLSLDPRLLQYIQRICAGERIRFNPVGDSRHRRLKLLGLIKASVGDGYCTIRNRIYDQVLSGIGGRPDEKRLSKGLLQRPSRSDDQIVLENVDPVQLLRAMQSAFGEADFEILCFTLGVKSANLAGPALHAKMKSLIEWHQQRGFYARLVEAVLKERPHLRKRMACCGNRD